MITSGLSPGLRGMVGASYTWPGFGRASGSTSRSSRFQSLWPVARITLEKKKKKKKKKKTRDPVEMFLPFPIGEDRGVPSSVIGGKSETSPSPPCAEEAARPTSLLDLFADDRGRRPPALDQQPRPATTRHPHPACPPRLGGNPSGNALGNGSDRERVASYSLSAAEYYKVRRARTGVCDSRQPRE